jgi:hypothetical protein
VCVTHRQVSHVAAVTHSAIDAGDEHHSRANSDMYTSGLCVRCCCVSAALWLAATSDLLTVTTTHQECAAVYQKYLAKSPVCSS